MSQYLRVLRYLKPYLPQFAMSIVLTLLFTISNIFMLPWCRDLMNEISNKNMIFFANQIFNGAMLWTIRVISQFSQYYLMTWISNHIIIDIQRNIYVKLLHFSQHFYADWKLGELITRLNSDSDKVRQAVMITFWEVIPQTLTFVGVLGYLLIMNWQLTLFTFVVMPLFVVMIMYFTSLLKRVTFQIQKKSADITHIIQETLSNIKLVQAYTMEQKEENKFIKESMRNFKYNMLNTRYKALMDGIVVMCQGIVFLSVLYLGGHMVTSDSLTGPELISFFTGIALLIDPINVLSKVYVSIQQALVSSERLFEVLDTKTVIQNTENAKEITLKGHVNIHNISFEYSKDSGEILKRLNLEVKEGEVIALVGLSGAGKTTLINLIPRFYDPSSGVITIDGIDLKEFDLHTLRSQIGMVLQDDMLFRGTILENIRYGSPNATETQAIEAAKKANAWEFIVAAKKGIYTKVGDKGNRLSGGQKQRISIARAILRDPKILILDEATSSLDSKSEQWVQEALIKLMKNRTTFVIAHRLSTIMHASKIVVLDKGEIQECGTHHQLLAKKGAYFHLYQMQFHHKTTS